MSEFGDMTRKWADEDAKYEAEAFEYVLCGEPPAKRLLALEEENAELHRQLITLNEQNRRLREALLRNSEMEYD